MTNANEAPTVRLSGRQGQAALNDQRIIEAARAVFITDPSAPIAQVAKRAGVGISALYTRYGSKEDLLRALARDGLQRVIDEIDAALASDGDPWTVFTAYMGRLVATGSSELTLALAGTFEPTQELNELAEIASTRGTELFERVKSALRPGVDVNDLGMLIEMVAAIRVVDSDRTQDLRRRYLAALLDGVRADQREPLAGEPPTWTEISERWTPRT